jgi:two-component system sensor histidine kinase KdpD
VQFDRVVRGVAVAILAPLAAALVATPLARSGSTPTVALYLLAVVIAAIVGGLWSGLGAGVLAAFAFAFVSPGGLDRPSEDPGSAVAAVVFLAVALVVGLLVGSVIEERSRAARREREAEMLGYFSSRLLTGEVPDRVLDEFAEVLLEPFGLARCDIWVELDGTEIRVQAEDPDQQPGGPRETVRLMIGSVSFGSLTAERPIGRRGLSREQRSLLEVAARHAALALDRARLDARARMATLDAETNQLRAAMFSSVTHDLRTPLASIKAGVTSLLDPRAVHDAEQQRELLTTVLEETDRLNRLVGNLLDLARVRAGALIPSRQSVAMDEIAEAVIARVRRSRSDVAIRLTAEDEAPEVSADPVQMDQVLTNLLENAVRHSPSGGEIVVSIARAPGAVRSRVLDQGPGVPFSERDRVFEAFYRGRTDPERPGAGLGLAIARAIVLAHGGTIWVEEGTGGGAAFVFDVPVETPA